MEEINDISLFDILNKLGQKNSYNFTYVTDVGEIYTNSKKWKNYSTKAGGKGAIKLVMHLLSCDYKKACSWLIKEVGHPSEQLITSAGFYWVKGRLGGRWEVAEFDGVAWLSGPEDGRENYITGPLINEPKY